jgi:hypothetical protein
MPFFVIFVLIIFCIQGKTVVSDLSARDLELIKEIVTVAKNDTEALFTTKLADLKNDMMMVLREESHQFVKRVYNAVRPCVAPVGGLTSLQ